MANNSFKAYGSPGTSNGGFAAYTPPSKSGGRHGVSGLVENLAGDIRDSAVGLPTGLIHLTEHPVDSVKAMGKSTWQDWSPLFEGHVGKFAHQFYAHPLAPLLDVASVFTGGAGIAGRAARLATDAGLVNETSAVGKLGEFAKPGKIEFTKLDKAGNEMPSMVKYTSSNPVSKSAQLAIHKVVNDAANHLPSWLGAPLSMNARYDRLETKMMSPRAAALQAQIHTFVRAGKDLTGRDSRMYRRAVLRNSYSQLRRMGREWDPAKPLPDGWAYVKGVPMVKAAGGRNGFFALNTPTIEQDMAGFARRYTSTNAKDVRGAARAGNGSGKVIIVPSHTLDKFVKESINSSKTVKLLYSKPVQVWKYLLLGTRPAYFVNNAVGNFLMYSVGHGGTAGFKGLVDALAQVKGPAAAIHSMGDVARRDMALNPHWMEANFRDQLNNTFSMSNKTGMGSKLYKYSMFPITHAVADQFLRRAAINAEMRRAPEVQALMRQGKSFDQAAEQALRGGSGMDRTAAANLRERVSQKVMDTMGDYHSMNSGERLLASVMPFYTWNRHALRFTKAAVRDHTLTSNLIAKQGQQGTAETEKVLGQIPSYLKGAIPLSMLGIGSGKGDRVPILQTTSLNPLATVPDALDAARALVSGGNFKPGEAIGSELNPVLTGIIQHLSGTNLSTGAPIPSHHGGLVGDVVTSTAEGLPQGALIQRLIQGNPKPHPNAQTGATSPFLFSKDKKTAIGSILGIPVKSMSKTAATKNFNEENKIKKGRKKKFVAYTG